MTNHELTERYIYAVVRHLPASSRAEVSRELEALIGDMLEEQCPQGEPTQEQLKATLRQLGSPQSLAASYHPNQAGLIPQPYYSLYRTVLPLVLAVACGGVALALVVGAALDPSALLAATPAVQFGKLIGMVVGGMFEAAVQVFFWVTLGFALAARKGTLPASQEDFLAHLPEIPRNRKPVGRVEPILGIVFSTLFAVVMIAAPQVICMVSTEYLGGAVPVFDLAVMARLRPVLLVIGLAGIAEGCAQLIEGWHTRRLMVIQLVCNAIVLAGTAVWLTTPGILSADYLAAVNSLFGVATTTVAVMGNLNWLVLGGVTLGVVLDSVQNVYTTLRR